MSTGPNFARSVDILPLYRVTKPQSGKTPVGLSTGNPATPDHEWMGEMNIHPPHSPFIRQVPQVMVVLVLGAGDRVHPSLRDRGKPAKKYLGVLAQSGILGYYWYFCLGYCPSETGILGYLLCTSLTLGVVRVSWDVSAMMAWQDLKSLAINGTLSNNTVFPYTTISRRNLGYCLLGPSLSVSLNWPWYWAIWPVDSCNAT